MTGNSISSNKGQAEKPRQRLKNVNGSSLCLQRDGQGRFVVFQALDVTSFGVGR